MFYISGFIKYYRRYFKYNIIKKMENLTNEHINYMTCVLRSRLTRFISIDATILFPDDVTESSKVEDFIGSFVGAFHYQSDRTISFVLFGKSDPEGNFDHVFLFYFNSPGKAIHPEDKQKLLHYLPDLSTNRHQYRIGLFVVKTSAHIMNWFANLMEAVEFCIGRSLISSFVSYQIINVKYRSSFVGPKANDDSRCRRNNDFKYNGYEFCSRMKKMTNIDAQFINFDEPRKPSYDASCATVTELNRHLFGCIVDEELELMNFLFLHRNQLPTLSTEVA